jgi:diketogulonate reductase-like aldo/keto reductase
MHNSFVFLLKTLQNLPVIPKTASKTRLLENLMSMNLKLTSEDMAELDTLNSVNYRNNLLEYAKNLPEYCFNIPF